MGEPRVLLISDGPALVDQVRRISESIPGLGFVVLDDTDAAYHYEGWEDVGLVLVHQADRGSAMQVSRLLRLISAARRPVATIVLGEAGDADQEGALLRMGVADYLELPLDGRRLAYLIDVLTVRRRGAAVAGQPGSGLATRVAGRAPGTPAREAPILDGETPRVAELREHVLRVAPQAATVLLGGETGTGKTRLARQIHDLSGRRDEPFLTVDCGLLAGTPIEGELFGHVQGAFDGAASDRVGMFAAAGRGTLFLDGIDALPLPVQAKLLAVVDDRAFEPIGATRAQPLEARLIAASNRPLDEEVAEQRFRADLYYRLNVVGFQLPPLRERRDAIATLADRFLADFAAAEGREFDPIGEDVVQALRAHDWPGNVRELENVMRRCVALCPGRSIRREDLPASVLEAPSRMTCPTAPLHPILAATFSRSSLAQTKGQAEYARITEALEKHNNNRLRAAGELGISRMTLYKKLYKYGLMVPSNAH